MFLQLVTLQKKTALPMAKPFSLSSFFCTMVIYSTKKQLRVVWIWIYVELFLQTFKNIDGIKK